jgi:hypothetical protein
VADLVLVGLDPGNPRVDVLPHDLFSDANDAITDGSHRLPQGGLPQQSCPPPSGERHDRPPLRHEAILSTEAAIVNRKR